jgi:hypothetical protein
MSEAKWLENALNATAGSFRWRVEYWTEWPDQEGDQEDTPVPVFVIRARTKEDYGDRGVLTVLQYITPDALWALGVEALASHIVQSAEESLTEELASLTDS